MASDSVEWTSEQMIENATSWSLCGDVALLNRLKQFSKTVISGAETLSTNVDKLLNNLEEIHLKLELTKNEFHNLRNTQFIENRVYEDDETLETDEQKQEEKEQTDEEKEAAIIKSIAKGLEIMEKYYDKVELSISDSEGESNEKSYVMRPKDLYADRPLPYVVGTPEWYKKWHVGLLPSDSESESEADEEVYSSSDSETGLPQNHTLASESSSELDFTTKEAHPDVHSTLNGSRDSKRLPSSDESSEQSGSVHSKAATSKRTFAEELAAKLGDVVSNEGMGREAAIKSVPKGQYGNSFSDEPPPLDEPDEAMLPKNAREGLFTASEDLFAKNNEVNSGVRKEENSATNVSKKENQQSFASSSGLKSRGLFDSSGSSSEEDLLAVTERRKFMNIPAVNPYMQPFKPTVPFVDDEPPELISKEEVQVPKKKPVGGKAIFGENVNIMLPKPALTEKIEAANENNVQQAKEMKKTGLFDDSSSDDEMFVPKPKTLPANISNTNKSKGLFDDFSSPLPASQPKKLNLFDDEDELLPPNFEKALNKPEENKRTLGNATAEPKEKVKPKKISLFDDDDDLLKEEEDLFSGIYKKSSLFDDLKDPSRKPAKGLFDDPEEHLSDNKEPKKVPEAPAKASFKGGKTTKPAGLFDDSHSSDEDLFSPKPKTGVNQSAVAVGEENTEEHVQKTNIDVKEERIEPSTSKPLSDIVVQADLRNEAEECAQKPVIDMGKTLETSTDAYGTSGNLSDEDICVDSQEKKLGADNNSELVSELKSTAQGEHKSSVNEEVVNEDIEEDTRAPKESLQIFNTIPPIDLFDPTPPPVDWDASSDNSAESDTFSLSDGILERAAYNQAPSASSVFDEAPPVLPILEINDINDSSGIVKDIGASIMDFHTDESFCPYASSSRRHSSDIFHDEQSQDSLFVTKNRNISLPVPSLRSIREQLEDTSKIDQFTPSGTLGDLEEGSSMFEDAGVQSKSKMNHSNDLEKRKSLFGGDSTGVKPQVAVSKPSPGKLKHNLNINVGALLPGAAPLKIRPKENLDEQVETPTKEILQPKPARPLARPRSEVFLRTNTHEHLEDGFEDLGGTEVLHSVTKDRAKIPIKRRPSSRRARHEAARKSMTDFSLYTEGRSDEAQDVESPCNNSHRENAKIPEDKSSNFKQVFDEENSDISTSNNDDTLAVSPEENSLTNNAKWEPRGRDLVENSLGKSAEPIENSTKAVSQQTVEGGWRVKLGEENEETLEAVGEMVDSKESSIANIWAEAEKKRIFDDSFEEDVFKPTSKGGKTSPDDWLFKSSKAPTLTSKPGKDLPSSDEDLLSGPKKPGSSESCLPNKIPASTSFLDESDSDGDLFGRKPTQSVGPAKTKTAQPVKKHSIFDDSDGSSEDDLFGAKSRKPGLASDTKRSVGLNAKRSEIKTAQIKKLESTQVTDFDPLSGFK